MPLEVLQQIQYLCKNIPKVEWSGVLFYTTEGSIKKPEEFKITLKTILPLDMGSSAYTEYNLDERFLSFLEEDFDERCTWKVGHIHSHNTMAVFFSGTDMAELNDNAPSHNFYLSLIVNNFMDFMAKVAFVADANKDIKQVPFFALDEEGQEYAIEEVDFEVKSKKLFIYDCNIDAPISKLEVSEQFAKQVATIMMPKPVKKVELPASPPGWRRPFSTPPRQPQKQEFKRPQKMEEPFEDWDFPIHAKPFGLFEGIEDLDDLGLNAIYEFAKDLFSFSDDIPEEDTLDDVLDILMDFELSPYELAKIVIDTYAKCFEKNFPTATEAEFVQYTHELLDLLEDQLATYPELKASVTVITNMINRFIENETGKHHTTGKV
jgi:hypothetical protein